MYLIWNVLDIEENGVTGNMEDLNKILSSEDMVWEKSEKGYPNMYFQPEATLLSPEGEQILKEGDLYVINYRRDDYFIGVLVEFFEEAHL